MINRRQLQWCKQQALNHFGTQGGAKNFLRGVPIFLTMTNNFKLCPTHFSRGGAKNFVGGIYPPASPCLRAW